MSDIQRAGTTPRYSDFTLHNGVVYCVEVPPDENADITTQTSAMLACLETLLMHPLPDRHGRLRCRECSVGSLAARRQRTEPRLCAGGAPGKTGLEGGDRGAGRRLATAKTGQYFFCIAYIHVIECIGRHTFGAGPSGAGP